MSLLTEFQELQGFVSEYHVDLVPDAESPPQFEQEVETCDHNEYHQQWDLGSSHWFENQYF